MKSLYFRHDISFLHDVEMNHLIKELGFKAYGYFWRLMEFLYTKDGFYHSDKLSLFATHWNIPIEELNEFITQFQNYGFIDLDMQGRIFIPYLNENLDYQKEQKLKKSKAGIRGNEVRYGKSYDNNSQSDNTATANESQCDNTYSQNEIEIENDLKKEKENVIEKEIEEKGKFERKKPKEKKLDDSQVQGYKYYGEVNKRAKSSFILTCKEYSIDENEFDVLTQSGKFVEYWGKNHWGKMGAEITDKQIEELAFEWINNPEYKKYH